MYSPLHRSQNSSIRRCIKFKHLSVDVLPVEEVIGGNAERGLPIRKYPGMRTDIPSSGRVSIGKSGLLLSIASICVRSVESSS